MKHNHTLHTYSALVRYAKPSLDIALRRGRREMTGSRTGMVGSLKIYVPGPGGYQQIDGSKFYDARYWEPEQYQQWHDAIWQQPRIGRVTVGESSEERSAGKECVSTCRSRVGPDH